MNRADQHALFQATNQGLLDIRQRELEYYASLNIAFGTQAALIGGFSYSVFTQNLLNEDNFYDVEVIADIYWITSSITIALAVHVILCTMLMEVLGPGLALHGPMGSMAVATEGMRIEQKQIIVSFTIMMAFFSISTALSFWVVMTFEGAMGSTVCFIIASYYWWKYCERTWLRFYWEDDDTNWSGQRRRGSTNTMMGEMDEERDPASSTINHHAATAAGAALPRKMTEQGRMRPNSGGGAAGGKKKIGLMSSFFRGLKSGGKSRHPSRRTSGSDNISDNTNNNNNDDNYPSQDPHLHDEGRGAVPAGIGGMLAPAPAPDNILPSSSIRRGIAMEGYLTMRAGAGGSAGGGSVTRVGSSSSSISGGLDSHSVVGGSSATGSVIGGATASSSSGTETGSVRSNRVVSQDPWQRKYFTLSNNGNIFIYKTRQDFRSHPKSPIYIRPLRLLDYYVEIDNIDYDSREADAASVGGTADDTKTTTGRKIGSLVIPSDADIKPYRFQMTLILRENADAELNAEANVGGMNAIDLRERRYRDHWMMRCDTEGELQLWISAIRDVCPSCFK